MSNLTAEIESVLSPTIGKVKADVYSQMVNDITALIDKVAAGKWLPIESALKDEPVWLFSPDLISADFNPKSMAEGYWQDDEGWIAAVWNNDQDCWDAKVIKPTYWMRFPPTPAILTPKRAIRKEGQ